MPVIDPRTLGEGDLEKLAGLFDELEREARRLGGADRRENVERLWDTVIAEIDRQIARTLGLPEDLADAARQLARAMMERRLARAGEARPGALRGAEEPLVRAERRRGGVGRTARREGGGLTEFM